MERLEYKLLRGFGGMFLVATLASLYFGNHYRKKAEIYNTSDVQGIIHLQSDLSDIAQERNIIRLADKVVTLGNLAKPLESKLKDIQKENPDIMKQVEEYEGYRQSAKGAMAMGILCGFMTLGIGISLYKERKKV